MTEATGEIATLIEQAAAQRGMQVTVQQVRQLAGGAINQNFLAELTDTSGESHRWVLRRGQRLPIPGSLDRRAEYDVVAHAFAMGVMVPEPIALIDTAEASASVFRWCPGQTDARTLLAHLSPARAQATQASDNSPTISPADEPLRALTRSLGMQLGRLHGRRCAQGAATTLTHALGTRPQSGLDASLNVLRDGFQRVKHPRSYLTAAYTACQQEAQDIRASRGAQTEPAVVSHNDFRLGNLLIDPSPCRLTAVLDWEFTAWSDPMADIGWLSAPCWRFGGPAVVAGFGGMEDLLAGYAQGADDAADVDRIVARMPRELDFWQRYAHLRWAIIAAQQGERAVSGDAEALELGLTGAMVASILQPVLAHYWGSLDQQTLQEPHPAMAGVDHLLAEAAQHLRKHLAGSLSGTQRYSALMSANAIRLARGGLRLPAQVRMDDARADLAADLAVWNFRG